MEDLFGKPLRRLVVALARTSAHMHSLFHSLTLSSMERCALFSFMIAHMFNSVNVI